MTGNTRVFYYVDSFNLKTLELISWGEQHPEKETWCYFCPEKEQNILTSELCVNQTGESAVCGADSLLIGLKICRIGNYFTLLAVCRWHVVSFKKCFESFCQQMLQVKNKFAVCIGDFNLDTKFSNDYTDSYLEMFSSSGFDNLIDTALTCA